MASRPSFVFFSAVVLAGANMRTVFASLSPLLEDVRDELGLSAAAAGLLTTAPVLCFGALAPLAPPLVRRVPMERVIAACAALTAAGAALRGVAGVAGLFLGTLLAGAAVAIADLRSCAAARAVRRREGPAHGRVLDGAHARRGRCGRGGGRARAASGKLASRARGVCAARRLGGARLGGSRRQDPRPASAAARPAPRPAAVVASGVLRAPADVVLLRPRVAAHDPRAGGLQRVGGGLAARPHDAIQFVPALLARIPDTRSLGRRPRLGLSHPRIDDNYRSTI